MRPDSLFSSHAYEIIRTIYSTPSTDAAENARVPILVQTMSQLRLINIATLDACMNHFTRLIDLTSADEPYVAALATMLGPCILRPRTETSLTLEEKHSYRLVRDLFNHKDSIFSELKRLSAMNHSPASETSMPRPRAISTDESNRKAHMEERNRALLEKANGGRSRGTSPAPGPRGHRRDRSTGGPETRFPVNIGSPVSSDRHRAGFGSNRQSLDVPGDGDFQAVEPTNGRESPPPAAALVETPVSTPTSTADKRSSTPFDKRSSTPIEKRNSLTRSGARFSSGRRVLHGASPSLASVQSGGGSDGAAHRGVTLEDNPMPIDQD